MIISGYFKPYAQRIGLCGLSLNVPDGFTDIRKYNATMAHKANHSFYPNVKNVQVSWNRAR